MRQGHPLAQTFTIQCETDENAGGRFLTSVDLYFAAKHTTLPVAIEIRNTENGYPGRKVLPYSRLNKYPVNINISDTAATATKFTFFASSPIE